MSWVNGWRDGMFPFGDIADQRFTLIFTLPRAAAPASRMGGDVQGDVTDNVGNGSAITAPAGSAVYAALAPIVFVPYHCNVAI